MNEWLQVIIEIVCNGIILFLFGKWIDVKIKKKERRISSHEEIVKTFLEELVKLNRTMILVNWTTRFNEIKELDSIMKLIEENILRQWIEIIAVYDTYQSDLKEFKEQYISMGNAWNLFIQQKDPIKLGEKLQTFKDMNIRLIEDIRDKY